MAWESKFVNFGVLKIEGKYVNVFYGSNSHERVQLYVGEPVSQASWAGGEINVYLMNGKVRRYFGTNSHEFKTVG